MTLNVKISSFDVAGGGFPPTHLIPAATAAPLTVTVSPYAVSYTHLTLPTKRIV